MKIPNLLSTIDEVNISMRTLKMILNCMRSHRRENESDPIETHEKTSLVLCLHLPCVVDFQIVTTTSK